MRLSSARWLEIDARAGASTLVVPLGSTEQHGPHLPLSTDTDVAVALAVRLAEARSEMIVAPALPPAAVALDAAAPGNDRPLTELDDRLRSDGVRAVSSNGVLGDPSGASAK